MIVAPAKSTIGSGTRLPRRSISPRRPPAPADLARGWCSEGAVTPQKIPCGPGAAQPAPGFLSGSLIRPGPTCRQACHPSSGPDDLEPVIPERRHIPLRRRLRPHHLVHRGGQQDRRPALFDRRLTISVTTSSVRPVASRARQSMVHGAMIASRAAPPARCAGGRGLDVIPAARVHRPAEAPGT